MKLISEEEIRKALADDGARIEAKYGGSNMVYTNYESRKAFCDEVNHNLLNCVAKAQLAKIQNYLASLGDEKLKEEVVKICLRYLTLCKQRDDYSPAMVEPELTDQIHALYMGRNMGQENKKDVK